MNNRIVNYRPPRIALSLIVLAALLHFLVGAGYFDLYVNRPAGIAVAVIGFAIMIGAWWQFRRHEIHICPTAPTSRLLTTGTYRFTRNPMYLGMTLMLLGLSLLVGTLPFYAVTLLFVMIINHHFCSYEERKLRDTFGEEFEIYSTKVRRWV